MNDIEIVKHVIQLLYPIKWLVQTSCMKSKNITAVLNTINYAISELSVIAEGDTDADF